MNNEPFNKDTVEAIPFSTINLSISASFIWNQKGRIQNLTKNILSVWNNAVQNEQISACCILRLVIITSNLSTEVSRWSKQLDQEWRVSSNNAIGQTLTWGDGKPETTYAIIILSGQIALDLLDNKSCAIGTFIHELAHVHDEYRFIHSFGQLPQITPSNWSTIRCFIARSTWSEFFAESIAYPTIMDCLLDEQVLAGATMLNEAIVAINQEIFEYQNHKEIGRVWSIAISQLSAVFNHLGRCLGLLNAAQQASEFQNLHNRFLQDITNSSFEWGNVIHQLQKELRILYKESHWDSDSFDNLSNTLDNGFRAVGLEPYKQ